MLGPTRSTRSLCYLTRHRWRNLLVHSDQVKELMVAQLLAHLAHPELSRLLQLFAIRARVPPQVWRLFVDLNLYQGLLYSHYFFGDKLSHKEHSIPSNKNFVLRGKVELTRHSFFMVSHKLTLIHLLDFGSTLSEINLLTKASQPQIRINVKNGLSPGLYLIWGLLNLLGWNSVKYKCYC